MFVQAVGAVRRDKPDMYVGQQVFQKVDAVELKAFYGLVEAGFQTAFQLGWGIGQRKIGNAVFGQTGNQMQRCGMSFDHAGKFGGGGRGVPSEDRHGMRPSEKGMGYCNADAGRCIENVSVYNMRGK